MILRVAEIYEMLVFSEDMAHTLWMMELSLIVRAINQTNLTISDLIFKLHGLLIDDYHAIVCGICYND